MNKGIQKIFSQVPGTYERINHILTLGLDVLWRKKAARIAASFQGRRWLDVCSGTGEMADYLNRRTKRTAGVVALDFSLPMMRKMAQKSRMRDVHLVIADVSAMPFRPNTFDVITISFATRNLNYNRHSLFKALAELRRVLTPAGYFVNLETSQPGQAWVRKMFHAYIRLVVRKIGRRISGSRAGYVYLAHTIPRFYPASEYAAILHQTGFRCVTIKKLLLGIAAIHISKK